MSASRASTAPSAPHLDTILRWALAIMLIGQITAGSTDTDIWGHTAFGLDILRTRHLASTDPYSFTSDLTWINHEWLWDVVTAAVYTSGGLGALLAVRAVLITAVVYLTDRAQRGLPPVLRMVALAAVIVACSSQWRGTRPQMASLTLAAVLFTNIDAWWTPLLFVVWANVHGGWLFGLAAVAIHAFVHPTPRRWATAAACLGATLVTPYGVYLWLALADAIQRGWSDVSEWQPVWRMAAGADALVLWTATACAAAWVWTRTTRDRFALIWSVTALAAAAGSRRLIALAALSCGMVLVPRWAGVRVATTPWTQRQRLALAAAVLVAAATGAPGVRSSTACFPPMAGWQAPEPDAVTFLRASGVTRVLPHFDFGEYAIFHLRDRMRVAIDNRRETVYSDAVVQANQRFTVGGDPDYPARIGADAVWWPATDTRLIAALTARGWIRRFDGPRTVVLMRQQGPIVRGRPTSGTPCFPNP